ncbi:MAG: PAQR family membrane homeostasis protein TrhA [Ilumatobacteraceae bacterium]|jgi:hemolysin III
MSHSPVFHHVTGEWRARWRGRIHGGAVLVAIPAGLALTVLASGPMATVATAIYSVSLVALFATSATYHLFTRSRRMQHMMQRADHCMVYVLIAGTYTPVCLLALPRPLGIILLVMVWGIAAVGMVLKAMWKARKFATSLYIVLGWVVLAVVPWVYRHVGVTTLSFYAVGGVVFTSGAVMFMRRYPRLRPEVFGFHEVWHVMTVAAVVLQFTATALLLRR